MKQTALYFNPTLDTVHINHEIDGRFLNLSYCTNKDTIRSIRALAIESRVFDHRDRFYIAGSLLCSFQSLETLILVVRDETGWDGTGASIREDMENALIIFKDSLTLHGGWKEQKLPAVKVMTSRAFENNL
jgi:hypothetical protein